MLKNLRGFYQRFFEFTFDAHRRRDGLTSGFGRSRWCSDRNLSAACPSTRWRCGEPDGGRSRTTYATAVPGELSTPGMGRCRFVAIRRCRARLRRYTEDPVPWDSWTAPAPTLEDLGSHSDNRASYNCDCPDPFSSLPKGAAHVWRGLAHHWGKFSSHRICLLLQVLQPFRDLVWLCRVLPPRPAMER